MVAKVRFKRDGDSRSTEMETGEVDGVDDSFRAAWKVLGMAAQ